VKVRAFRVVKKRWAKAAFDGEGARLWGGRWNSPGRPAVYCAGHVSLAILEVVVHADLALAPHYVVIPVNFDEALVESLDPGRLPASWRRHPAPAAVVALGDEWLREGRSPVLRVPSVVVPAEPNFILNPLHPAFREIEIGKPEVLKVDARLSKGRG
jgi:RES domain-containing protein